MWVTQTYLRSPDPDAQLHVYYLFQEYNEEEKMLTEAVQKELAHLGERYGRTVTLYMPEPNSAGRVEAELRGMEPLWWSLFDRLPGVLIRRRPLEEYAGQEREAFYIPLRTDSGPIASTDQIATMIQTLTDLTDRQLEWEFANRRPEREVKKNADLFDAIEMKPGIFGFKVDLKKLIARGQ